MSDPLDELFLGLRNQPPPTSFVGPAAVRRRGRHRTQRSAVAAGAAVLVVGAVVGVSTVPSRTSGPPPTPLTSGSPLSSAGAADAVLRPGDLGPGDWRAVSGELFEGPLWFWANLCNAPELGTSTLDHQLWLDTVYYGNGQPGVFVAVVERYEPGFAARNVDDARAAVARCRFGEFTVVDTGFAGDQSMLVHQDPDRYIAVVRVGDLVATVLGAVGRDATVVRSLASTAASRLIS
jgi:hypothetical protein